MQRSETTATAQMKLGLIDIDNGGIHTIATLVVMIGINSAPNSLSLKSHHEGFSNAP
jgi:hypothetical protein